MSEPGRPRDRTIDPIAFRCVPESGRVAASPFLVGLFDRNPWRGLAKPVSSPSRPTTTGGRVAHAAIVPHKGLVGRLATVAVHMPAPSHVGIADRFGQP